MDIYITHKVVVTENVMRNHKVDVYLIAAKCYSYTICYYIVVSLESVKLGDYQRNGIQSRFLLIWLRYGKDIQIM